MIQSQEDPQNFPAEKGLRIFRDIHGERSHLAGERSHQGFRPAVKNRLAGLVDHIQAHAMTVTTLHPGGLLNFQAKEEKGRNLHAEGNRLAEEINLLDFLPGVINLQAAQAGLLPVHAMIVKTQDQLVHQNLPAR
jgi:hypothetical protein